MTPPQMQPELIDGKWWLVGDDEPIGPYQTKAEAERSHRELIQFYRHIDDRHWFTTEPAAMAD